MIYFTQSKGACSFEIEDYLATIDRETWRVYAEYPHGKHWDIIEGNFIKLTSVQDMQAIKNWKIRIQELKYFLNQTDYKAIKYSEGCYTEEEYAITLNERQSWRDEINQLEEMLFKSEV